MLICFENPLTPETALTSYLDIPQLGQLDTEPASQRHLHLFPFNLVSEEMGGYHFPHFVDELKGKSNLYMTS